LAGGVDFLESIPRLLKSLKIRAQAGSCANLPKMKKMTKKRERKL
jgi:hypothetical protein